MLPKPRLAVITESLGVGGTESHLLRLLPQLAESYEIAVYCLTERGSRAERLRPAIEVFGPAKPRQRRRSLQYGMQILGAAAGLHSLFRRWRPDIVHFYLPGPYLVGGPVAIAGRVPIKIMSRRSLSLYQQSWPAAARIERLLHRSMDAVTGNSRAVVEELRSEGVPSSRLHLIYNGIEMAPVASTRAEARSALGLAQDALIGVLVANLIPYKGHQELIEGLGKIASELPASWRILFAGRDEGQEAKLKRRAEALGIGTNIQFLGERSDVPRLLAAADFGLLPSREEGFSNVVLEAMAAALPMIVTRVGGNPEAVLDGKTGIVVPPRDADALGQAILRLARDPALRARLGQAGRLRIEREFSLDRCVQAHDELYQGLLAAAPRAHLRRAQEA